nr:copia protein [Tanacetum cinerariifolium]
MASEYNNSKPEFIYMNFQDSSEDSQSVPSKTELDNLFGLLYEEYYATSPQEMSDNSATNTLYNEDTSSSSSIVVKEDEAPQIVSSSAEQVVHQSPRGIFICQSQYTMDLLKRHGMEKCDTISTPIATIKLDADLQGTQVDQTKYHSMIGGLMYLTVSRPDTAFATFICARYQACPIEKHFKEVKQIFQYLRQTINMGLWYSKDFEFELIAYLDADHAGCNDDCKSTSGGIQFLGDKLVSWSKKQDCTGMSTTEAEYVSLYACCAQVIWMRTQLLDYEFRYNKIPMYCDSNSAIAISCNPVQHATKHINIRYHFFVETEYQLADLSTKSLLRERFEYLVHRIGMKCVTLTELERQAKLCSSMNDHTSKTLCK